MRYTETFLQNGGSTDSNRSWLASGWTISQRQSSSACEFSVFAARGGVACWPRCFASRFTTAVSGT